MNPQELYAKYLFIKFINNLANENEITETIVLLKDKHSVIWFEEVMDQTLISNIELDNNSDDLQLDIHFKCIENRLVDPTVAIEISERFEIIPSLDHIIN